MMGRDLKLPFMSGLLLTFVTCIVAQEKDGIVEPYWEKRTLNEFEEFPVKFPSSDDGKSILSNCIKRTHS